MRLSVLLSLVVVLVGCTQTELIDRPTLDQRYRETQLAEGVLSVVPIRPDPETEPPVVVNWWYAGTRDGQHQIVYRELTWDSQRKPIGAEARYRIVSTQLPIAEPFAMTSDESRWLPLYEAAANEIEPPADLPTARKAPNPFEADPIRQPDEPVPQLPMAH